MNNKRLMHYNSKMTG